MVIDSLLWSQRHEDRHDHFLNSLVGNMPTIVENLQTKKQASVWVRIDIHCLAKWMKDKRSKSLVKPQGQESTITKAQVVHLVGGRDTPVVLSHNKQNRDEHGNACVG
jgi:hypothetical protein